MAIKVSIALARQMGLQTPQPRRQRSPRRPKVSPPSEPSIDALVLLCRANGLPEPETEFKFALPERQWRFDYCFRGLPQGRQVALEVEGAVWVQGRHTRGKGFLEDVLKYNEAACRGWVVVRCVPDDIKTGNVIGLLRRVLR